MNSWPIWVYPADNKPDKRGITIVRNLDKAALAALEAGKKVLLMPSDTTNTVGGLFQTDYWNYRMFKGICESNGKPVSPGTLGILTDPSHPVFREFPTEEHTDWQWFPVLKASRPMILDALRGYKPIVQVIDNVERNHRLGLLFWCAVRTWRARWSIPRDVSSTRPCWITCVPTNSIPRSRSVRTGWSASSAKRWRSNSLRMYKTSPMNNKWMLAALLLAAACSPREAIPEAPDYASAESWYVTDRGADVDLFYISSTETFDAISVPRKPSMRRWAGRCSTMPRRRTPRPAPACGVKWKAWTGSWPAT